MARKMTVSIKAVIRAMKAAGLEDNWASNYDKAGPEGRRFPGGDNFGFLYNHLKSAHYAAWYCRAFGISQLRIDAALEHAKKATSVQSEGKLFRKILSWEDIAMDAQIFIDKNLRLPTQGIRGGP